MIYDAHGARIAILEPDGTRTELGSVARLSSLEPFALPDLSWGSVRGHFFPVLVSARSLRQLRAAILDCRGRAPLVCHVWARQRSAP